METAIITAKDGRRYEIVGKMAPDTIKVEDNLFNAAKALVALVEPSVLSTKKIHLIKALREATFAGGNGSGLKEAKDAIEAAIAYAENNLPTVAELGGIAYGDVLELLGGERVTVKAFGTVTLTDTNGVRHSTLDFKQAKVVSRGTETSRLNPDGVFTG